VGGLARLWTVVTQWSYSWSVSGCSLSSFDRISDLTGHGTLVTILA